MDKFIFRVSGGLGKNICATAVIKQIKQRFPDSILHVQASYPDVFVNIPEVEEIYPYPHPIPNFYKYHSDFDILEIEPYLDLLYRSGKDHIISCWCRKLSLNLPDKLQGIINLDEGEIETGKNILASLKFNGPLIGFQYVGGTSFQQPENANDTTRIKHMRDLPFEVAQEVVDKLAKQGLGVLQISLPTEKRLKNCFQLMDNNILQARYLFAILHHLQGGIFIDSFAQHAWVALNKKNAVVLWGGTNPKSLGYVQNTNLVNKDSCNMLHCNRPDTFMFDFQGNGQLWKCPFSGRCMRFSSDLIVQTFLAEFQKEMKKCEK